MEHNIGEEPEYRELLVRENAELRASLARGLEQSAAGDTVELGSFSGEDD